MKKKIIFIILLMALFVYNVEAFNIDVDKIDLNSKANKLVSNLNSAYKIETDGFDKKIINDVEIEALSKKIVKIAIDKKDIQERRKELVSYIYLSNNNGFDTLNSDMFIKMFLEQIDKEKIEVSRYKDIKTVMTDMNDAMSFVYFDSAKVNGEDKDVIMGLWFKENENGYRLYFPWIKIDDDLNEYFKRITNNEDKGEVISGTFNALSFNGSEDIVTDEILTNLYNENKNKVVQITGMDGNGSNTYGSGFFLRKGIVVTTWSLFLQFLTNSNYIYVNDCNGNTYNVLGVVAADANYDVVVLKIDGNVGEEVKLGESISLKTDDKLFMINSKYNSGFSISYGSFISQENGRLRNLFLLGNSDIGAALFDNQGNVVGINVGDQLYSELSYANSTDYLKKLQDVLIKKSYGNITYTILDTFKQEYYYSLNDEVNYNYIDKNVWEEYKNIGDIETNITLPLVKGSYKDKVLSLRYKVNGSESIEVMYFVSDYIDNLIKDGYILTYEDRLKKVFKNDKYKVVIKSNFNYLIILILENKWNINFRIILFF